MSSLEAMKADHLPSVAIAVYVTTLRVQPIAEKARVGTVEIRWPVSRTGACARRDLIVGDNVSAHVSFHSP